MISKINIYTDDTAIVAQHENFENIEEKLEATLDVLENIIGVFFINIHTHLSGDQKYDFFHHLY